MLIDVALVHLIQIGAGGQLKACVPFNPDIAQPEVGAFLGCFRRAFADGNNGTRLVRTQHNEDVTRAGFRPHVVEHLDPGLGMKIP